MDWWMGSVERVTHNWPKLEKMLHWRRASDIYTDEYDSRLALVLWIRITLMRIGIRLITLMRIRIQLITLMRIRIFIWCGFGFLFDADPDEDPDADPQHCCNIYICNTVKSAHTHQVGWRHLSIPRPQKPAAGQKIEEALRLLDYAAHRRPNINSAHQWSDNWPQNPPKAAAIAGVLGDCYWSNFSTARGGFLRCYWLNSDQREGRNSGALDEDCPVGFRRPDSAAVAAQDQGPASWTNKKIKIKEL